ncbi:hypothetical protein L228DRAFT_265346 [Xylona heveae TC161]|uniref:3-ketosteroid reductase n=1 Tax=Xylona heveae (strain CBS 132557 / TC161) TaxID=1328760 RepID=A0A165IFV2_XYLHT|nr:hypothetical protein L228DRAFT_265346 [Xylona heveae TC161]KZF24835.1 hypothetical protein L228DRAFT_265346 [Xylona heveae TC161]
MPQRGKTFTESIRDQRGRNQFNFPYCSVATAYVSKVSVDTTVLAANTSQEAVAMDQHYEEEKATLSTSYFLVTGANSGLGFSICCRLIDEFLFTKPQSERLCIIVTTRDARKGNDTLDRLSKHLRRTTRSAEGSLKGVAFLLESRVTFRSEILDLNSLLSVQALSKKLLETTPRLDGVILNAGFGGWTGINWFEATWTILTDWVQATTWPTYKVSGYGWVTKPQLPSTASGRTEQGKKPIETGAAEPQLGEVFCSNVFGHYLLCHNLLPLLKAPLLPHPGRIIWVSSLEAYGHTLQADDIQGMRSLMPYETSKRLTDVLSLTSTLPCTATWVDQYLDSKPERSSKSIQPDNDDVSNEATHSRPRMYVSHPGIVATAIFPLPYILWLCMTGVFYMSRWLGSPWHTVKSYTAACAMVWLALAPQERLDNMEHNDGPGKWGTATDAFGRERVSRTDVDGWGYGGVPGEVSGLGPERIKGRRRGAKDLTPEMRQEFEDLGRSCWKEMEDLRLDWEKRLASVKPTDA